MNAQQRPLNISELNARVKDLLDGTAALKGLLVVGEISGYKYQASSGHHYFTLKDDFARVECAFFRGNAWGLSFRPANGMRVIVRADAGLYPRDGRFQLYVRQMMPAGEGEYLLRLAALKAKLEAEGLFAPERKRPIPRMPRVIGVVTSVSGDAIRDIVKVSRRRNPHISILIADTRVQGERGPAEIIAAIERLNRDGRADVLLVGRGGGESDTLLTFNDEGVVRAIAASRIPVITCVGHETHYTLSDYAADERTSTPTDAATRAVPDIAQMREALSGLMDRVYAAMAAGQRLRRAQMARVSQSAVLRYPERMLIDTKRQALTGLSARLSTVMPMQLERRRHRLAAMDASLRSLNPEAVLNRGYAIVSREGRIVPGAAALAPGDIIDIRMAGGSIGAEVRSTRIEDNENE